MLTLLVDSNGGKVGSLVLVLRAVSLRSGPACGRSARGVRDVLSGGRRRYVSDTQRSDSAWFTGARRWLSLGPHAQIKARLSFLTLQQQDDSGSWRIIGVLRTLCRRGDWSTYAKQHLWAKQTVNPPHLWWNAGGTAPDSHWPKVVLTWWCHRGSVVSLAYRLNVWLRSRGPSPFDVK